MEIEIKVRLPDPDIADADLEACARHILLLLAAKLIESSVKWNGNNIPQTRNTSSS